MDQDTLITYILCYIICGTAMILNKDEPETKLEVLKLSSPGDLSLILDIGKIYVKKFYFKRKQNDIDFN